MSRKICGFLLSIVLGSMFLSTKTFSQITVQTLTEDGAWCWFSDSRAILVDNSVVTGWVKENGTIEASRFHLKSMKSEMSELYFRLEADDHNNPAFTTTSDGQVLAFYTRHSRKDLFRNSWDGNDTFRFDKPQFIHPWSENELEKYPVQTMTYANPYRLEDENNRIYVFGRWTGFKPNVIWSDDDGKTWSNSKVFITNYPFHPRNRPYVKYYSDGKSRIHMMFTDGHPRVEPTNSVYYAYYENGSFYRADGNEIASMNTIPFEPKDATIVYTSTPEEGRAWIADISADSLDNPVLLYTRSPTEENHEYWYAHFNGQEWIDRKIVDSGGWFPQTAEGRTEREPHYFGGMSLHPDNPSVLYLSREIEGVFEIERWETDDFGKNWDQTSITKNSTLDNVRPYVPRGLANSEDEVVLWMENERYIHYTDYRSAIKIAVLKL